MKYLRYNSAKTSTLYLKIYDQAIIELGAHGCFAKDDVLTKVGFGVLANSDEFRWDYIIKMIEEKTDTELIPLVPAFFSRRNKRREITDGYVANGGGGKARRVAGYASISEQNSALVLQRLEQKFGRLRGIANSVNRTGAHARQAGMNNVGLIQVVGRPQIIDEAGEAA
jgi:hypothetical protein